MHGITKPRNRLFMSRGWLPLMLLLGVLPAPLVAQHRPVVAAASDLQFALEGISQAFTAETGERVTLVFGSSGNLVRQAMSGAPFELFLSADEAFVDMLADSGHTRDRGTLYGIGRIVLFAPRGSPLALDEQMHGLRELLARNKAIRFAIANPEHAPYGRAAEAVLRARGLWDAVQPALVLGENISQAAQFATSGGAVGGILAYSLVLAPALAGRGTYALIPESLHPPLRQRMVLLKRAGPAAQRFYEYLQGRTARTLFEQYGFARPD
jgi:molybdate transport system substrate-binding protein